MDRTLACEAENLGSTPNECTHENSGLTPLFFYRQKVSPPRKGCHSRAGGNPAPYKSINKSILLHYRSFIYY